MAPNIRHKLPAAWREKLTDILNAKLTPSAGICPRCSEAEVILAEDVVTPAVWREGVSLGSPSYPQAMLVCRNCGHTSYYNLIALDVLERVSEAGSEKSPADDKTDD